MEPEIFLTALLLLAKGCEVLTQRVEFCTQSCSPTLCTTSYLQPACGQCAVPTIFKPIITPVESIPLPPAVPCLPEFCGYPYPPPMPMPMPPICLGGKNNDDWHHLLYFLIFALRNRGCGNSCGGNWGSGCGGGFGGGFGGGCGGGCGGYGCGGGCGCGCVGNCAYDSCSNFGGINNNGNDVIYVPYPIAVPMNSPTSFPWATLLDSSPTPSAAPSSISYDSKDPNEINLTIRTDCQSKK